MIIWNYAAKNASSLSFIILVDNKGFNRKVKIPTHFPHPPSHLSSLFLPSFFPNPRLLDIDLYLHNLAGQNQQKLPYRGEAEFWLGDRG